MVKHLLFEYNGEGTFYWTYSDLNIASKQHILLREFLVPKENL